MAFDPITSWHTEDRSARTVRSFGEHHADDIARHVADARPPRRIIRQLLQMTWRVARTAAHSWTHLRRAPAVPTSGAGTLD
jgi:hypothetical protein